MNNWKNTAKTAAVSAAMSIVLAMTVWSQPTNATSASGSSVSVTPATSSGPSASRAGKKADLKGACMAAAIELESSREMIAALETENSLLKERLDTEKRLTSALEELTQTQKAESTALRAAIEAKNETISAKDAVIAAQDKLNAELKAKRVSPWRRLGDVLIGAAAIAILK